jgi:hypothetical protein
MSLSTETYDDLIAQVEAQVMYTFTPTETPRIDSVINMAAKRIFKSSVWWERYLVVSEPRTVTGNLVEFTEDSYHVKGAGTADVNGLYVRNGTFNTLPRYSLYEGDGTTVRHNIEAEDSSGTQWIIGNDTTSVYNVTTAATTTPPGSGWELDDGVAPAPRVYALSDMETILQVNRYDLTSSPGYCPVGYHVTSRGVELHSDDLDEVYVTYRKPLTDKFGDGTGGTTSAIPSEWFNYIALYAARTYQMASRQSNDSPFVGIGARELDEAKQDALMKLEEQNISNSIAKRIQTHLQYNTQLN